MRDIRLLVLDIDGTISGHSNQVSPEVIKAIQAVQKQGVRVAIATGRMFKSARRFHEIIASDLPIIAYNGAWIQNPLDQKLHRQLSVAADICIDILDYLTAEPWRSQLHLHIYRDDELYVAELTTRTKDWKRRGEEGLIEITTNQSDPHASD